jgi:hypothetical protein
LNNLKPIAFNCATKYKVKNYAMKLIDIFSYLFLKYCSKGQQAVFKVQVFKIIDKNIISVHRLVYANVSGDYGSPK